MNCYGWNGTETYGRREEINGEGAVVRNDLSFSKIDIDALLRSGEYITADEYRESHK